ncbi:hypothetical protein LTR64_008800 [Lithohypha guttulata]|uniref:uncharacterized protein n=1 Tax=Lithohypha guttulata TaxID=1690604 RepID=UPI00315CFE9A
MQGQPASTSQVSNNSVAKVFHDVRSTSKHEPLDIVLGGENFHVNPLASTSATGVRAASDEKCLPQMAEVSETGLGRFLSFTSKLGQARYAKQLVDFIVEGSNLRDLFDVGPEGGVWWLDVLNPTKAELDVIASAFKIHRLKKEDIETQEASEKVELFSQYCFVCFRSFEMNKPCDDCDFVSLSPDYICYAMIDDIVDSFAPIIHEAEIESQKIEDQVFIAREDDFLALLRQIGDCRKRVLNLMRPLGGKANVIKGFAKRCNEQYRITPRGDIGLYLGDIQDHVVTVMSNVGHIEKMLSRSHANYLAQSSVDSILEGNYTNRSLAKIMVVATILVPLNLITGLFGMNVHVPGQDLSGYSWFGGILGVIVLFVSVSLLLAKKMKLI